MYKCSKIVENSKYKRKRHKLSNSAILDTEYLGPPKQHKQ